MQVAPPTNLWGLSITADQGASRVEIGSTAVALRGGPLAKIRFFRWDLRDFGFTDARLNPDGNSWALTLAIDLADETIHLWQGDGVFYTPEGQRRAHGDAPGSGAANPRWHPKSPQLWPVVDAVALPFRGQFRSAGYVGYVFGESENSTLSILLCQDDEQDVEDHYASEE